MEIILLSLHIKSTGTHHIASMGDTDAIKYTALA